MEADLIARILLLLTVANGAPVLAAKLLADRWAHPIDAGVVCRDGHPVLGRSKTVRGLAASLLATAACAPVVELMFIDGLLLAAAAMAGDLAASFIKRRMGLAPSSMAFGLDQIPETLLPCLVLAERLGLSWGDIIAVVGCFLVGELVVSRLLFRLGIRDRPY
jgi:hypothetical protein